jgi:pSer/pThr/pTyr-binding forkhead associated (FHA) protein
MEEALQASERHLTQEDDRQDQTLIEPRGLERANGVVAGWGTATFTQKTEAVIHIQGASEPVIVRPDGEFLIGRSEADGNSSVGLDLAAFDGWRHGVSRIHAKLHHNPTSKALLITDLNSTNGTYVNERRLSADTPTRLRDGDMVRLGDLILRVYFR